MRLSGQWFVVLALSLGSGACFPDPPTVHEDTTGDGAGEVEDARDGASDAVDDAAPDVGGDTTRPDAVDGDDATKADTEVPEVDAGDGDSGCPGAEAPDGRCLEAPAPPTDLGVTAGSTSLTLTWTASADADGYRVSRCAKAVCTDADFERLTEAPISATQFVDETAAGPALPPAPTAAASADAADRVFVSWSSVVTPEAPSYRFRVTALNTAGESPPSLEAEGRLQVDPVSGYELAIDDGAFVAVGNNTSASDLEAPAPTLAAGTATASSGTHAAFVRVEATGYTSTLGATRRYRVRAVTATRRGEVSNEAVGRRSNGALSLQWERSSGTESADFVSLVGATSASFEDLSAPSDGATRWYRLVVSAAGAEPARSVAVPGWRLPPPGVPGGVRATSDLTDRVTVSWEAVPGASGYEVLRNSQVVTSAGGVMALSFDDLAAPAPPAWSAPTEVTASTTLSDGIALEWTPPVRPLGATADYQVRALNGAGLGPPSAQATGRRSAPETRAYEIERVVDGQITLLSSGSVAPLWHDLAAPIGTVEPGNVEVGLSEHRNRVELRASQPTLTLPKPARYRVRGVYEVGSTTPWSAAAEGRVTVGALMLKWQRSADPSPTTLFDLPGANQLSFDDTAAPASGDARWYSLTATAVGANPWRSAPQPGRRLAFASVTPGDTSCAISTDRRLWCWDLGGLRRDDSIAEVAAFVKVGASQCALTTGATVLCRGPNFTGELGNGTFEGNSEWARVIGLENVRSIAAWSAVCAVKNDGTIDCWGEGRSGQIGNGRFENQPLPTRVLVSPAIPLVDAVEVRTSASYACARLAPSGLVRCWGQNHSAQLGASPATTMETAFAYDPVTVGGSALEIATGEGHACALLENGTVSCWGQNSSGALGSEVSGVSTVGIQVSGIASCAGIASSRSTNCARLSSGTVKCWGENQDGELGADFNGGSSSSPVQVLNLNAVTSIASGNGTWCAIEAGAVWCWGRNMNGQVGDGTTVNRRVPFELPLP